MNKNEAIVFYFLFSIPFYALIDNTLFVSLFFLSQQNDDDDDDE